MSGRARTSLDPTAEATSIASGRHDRSRSERFSSRAVAAGPAALAAVAALAVYCRTLAPSIVWGDSPELTTAAYCAGVPHPTGYPLYMLLAHAFLGLWPFGSPAHRMNLLAALSGAGAVALIYLLLWQITRARWISLITALLFAFSRTFWSQAIIAEHYAFEVLAIAAVLGCVLAWDRRGDRRWLLASAFVYGLCLTHHMMSLLLAPGMLAFALTSRHRAQFLRELRWALPLFLLPLCLYAYLPLAALRDPPTNWGDPRTWDRFLAHVTGRQYHTDMFHLTRAQFLSQVRDYIHFLPAQFTPTLLGLAPLGAGCLAWRRRRLFLLTLLVYLADVAYGLNYYIYNVEIYYLPSHLMVALWIGFGLRQIGGWLRLLWRRLAVAVPKRRALEAMLAPTMLLLPLMVLSANWALNDRHEDWNALVYARATLAAMKPNAIVLGAGDDYYFPLLYARFVECRRPDVTLLSAFDALRPSRLRLITRLAGANLLVRVPSHFGASSRDAFDDRLLKRFVADNLARHPVYLLAGPRALSMRTLSGVIAPYYQLSTTNMPSLEVTRRPPRLGIAAQMPRRLVQASFGVQESGGLSGALQFLGCRARPVAGSDVPMLRVTYYWRVNHQARARNAKIWVVFTDVAGRYRRQPDGSPEFQNIHSLAYGLAQHGVPLPRLLQETYTLSVPAAEWNQPLRMRLAVAVHGRFLPVASQRSPWVEVGQLSVPGSMQKSGDLVMAAAPAPRVRISQAPDRAPTGR